MESIASIRIRNALDGSVGPVRAKLLDFNAHNIFRKSFLDELSVCKKEMKLPEIFFLEKGNDDNRQPPVDAIARLSYKYGIGTTHSKKDLVAVITWKILMQRISNSDTLISLSDNTIVRPKAVCTLRDYASGNGALYRTDFKNAARNLARNVAYMLRINA